MQLFRYGSRRETKCVNLLVRGPHDTRTAVPSLSQVMRRSPRKTWPWAVEEKIWPGEMPEKVPWISGMLSPLHTTNASVTTPPSRHGGYCFFASAACTSQPLPMQVCSRPPAPKWSRSNLTTSGVSVGAPSMVRASRKAHWHDLKSSALSRKCISALSKVDHQT